MKIRKLIPGKEAILCRTKEELECLQDNGYFYKSYKFEKPIWIRIIEGVSSHYMSERPFYHWDKPGREYYEGEGLTCLEFKDILLSKDEEETEETNLSAIELLEWIAEYFDDIDICAEVFGKEYCACSIDTLIEHLGVDEIIRRIVEWNKKQKEIAEKMELEWNYYCIIRGIETKDIYCEERITDIPDFATYAEIERRAKEIFVRYVMKNGNADGYEMIIKKIYRVK